MRTKASAPVFFVRLLKVNPKKFERLYATISSFFKSEAASLDGLLDAHCYASEDHRRILIVVEWKTRKAWSRAQWDARLGALVEKIALNAETLEFNLYQCANVAGLATA